MFGKVLWGEEDVDDYGKSPTHSSLSQNVPEFIPGFIPGFIPACIPACCDCMAFIEGLLLFCKCPNSGANSESSAVDPLALLVWFPADNPAEGYRGEEPTGFIPNDPDIVGFILDNPVMPEFILDVDNPVIPVFIPDILVEPVIPEPIPVLPEFIPAIP